MGFLVLLLLLVPSGDATAEHALDLFRDIANQEIVFLGNQNTTSLYNTFVHDLKQQHCYGIENTTMRCGPLPKKLVLFEAESAAKILEGLFRYPHALFIGQINFTSPTVESIRQIIADEKNRDASYTLDFITVGSFETKLHSDFYDTLWNAGVRVNNAYNIRPLDIFQRIRIALYYLEDDYDEVF